MIENVLYTSQNHTDMFIRVILEMSLEAAYGADD